MTPPAKPRKTANPSKPAKTKTYASAGVDIDRGDALVDHIKTLAKGIGGFGATHALPRGMKNPRLVSSTDGVGTKLLVAQAAGRHDTIGIDLVGMVVNDLIVCGAKPLFFLDYFATGKLEDGVAKAILSGIAEGCRQAGCPLVGGETAEMPGMYAPGHYDLAGFGVGVVEADALVDGRGVEPADLVVGLASSGLHSNGYSLARDVLMDGATPAARRAALRRKLWKGGPTAADALLAPTRIYVKPVIEMMKRGLVQAAAHITGGGLAGNLVRSLPKGRVAYIDRGQWQPPRVFEEIARRGPVATEEMFRVFNMGIGFVLIVRPDQFKAVQAIAAKHGETAQAIGWIDAAPRKGDPPRVELVERA
jgi:phosphoribosylformylglycinamidine cyclo-ligase